MVGSLKPFLDLPVCEHSPAPRSGWARASSLAPWRSGPPLPWSRAGHSWPWSWARCGRSACDRRGNPGWRAPEGLRANGWAAGEFRPSFKSEIWSESYSTREKIIREEAVRSEIHGINGLRPTLIKQITDLVIVEKFRGPALAVGVHHLKQLPGELEWRRLTVHLSRAEIVRASWVGDKNK